LLCIFSIKMLFLTLHSSEPADHCWPKTQTEAFKLCSLYSEPLSEEKTEKNPKMLCTINSNLTACYISMGCVRPATHLHLLCFPTSVTLKHRFWGAEICVVSDSQDRLDGSGALKLYSQLLCSLLLQKVTQQVRCRLSVNYTFFEFWHCFFQCGKYLRGNFARW